MAAFLANVGLNASHSVRSPLLPDGSFVLLPVPEKMPWSPPMLRMGDLPSAAGRVPPSWFERGVHLDPDLASTPATYGDNCATAGRAFSLRRAEPGDVIVFLARLHDGIRAAFYLVGVLVIDELRACLREDPGPGWWDGNAHVRRARAGAGWNGFWVFRGDPSSRPLPAAVKFGRQEAETVFDTPWNWRAGRSELQTIGSYTRAVRRLTGDSERRLRELVRA